MVYFDVLYTLGTYRVSKNIILGDGFVDDSPAGSIILFVLLMFGSAYFSGTEIS